MKDRHTTILPNLIEELGHLRRRVFTQQELISALRIYLNKDPAAERLRVEDLLELLGDHGLRVVELASRHYSSMIRYAWKDASPFEIGLSLKPQAYLSHGTAALLHGLTSDSDVIYVNKEQSQKAQGAGGLTQESLDRAFAGAQRTSNYIFENGQHAYVLLSGKSTHRLGVVDLVGPQGELLNATGLERTLIDISVRPNYAGGVRQVLSAYRASRNKGLSIDLLLKTLSDLRYLYPYHQAIGFYLENAGYDEAEVAKVRSLGIDFDFYLTYGMDDPVHDPNWRVYYPRDLQDML